jgi:anaerobic ribonucleoside-triphosphate reductase activating protein
MHPENIEGTLKLAKAFKEKYPNKTIWVWSGFLFEKLKKEEVLKYINVLVDGQYKDELHDFRLKYRGSSNQRVIDVQKSLKSGKICEINLEEMLI